MIDYTAFNNVKSLMKDKFPQLLEIYLRDTNNYLEHINNQDCMDTLVKAAHGMKSTSGSMGLTEVRQEAEKLEYMARQGSASPDELITQSQTLANALKEAEKFIKAELENFDTGE